jgi:phage gp36-like protein
MCASQALRGPGENIMAYATPADLEAAFGTKELILLADRDRDQVPDGPVMDRAIEDAEGEINSYLASRYQLPLAPVPAQIRAICCDIARYRMDAANPRQATKDRYEAALATLRDLAMGKSTLGSSAALAGDPLANTPPPAQVQSFQGERVFSNERLAGY